MIIIYSETTAVAESVEQNWLQYMKAVHLPALMETGMFLDYRFLKIPASTGVDVSYNLQLRCESNEKFNEFKAFHENKFQKQIAERYQGNYGAFNTTLEELQNG